MAAAYVKRGGGVTSNASHIPIERDGKLFAKCDPKMEIVINEQRIVNECARCRPLARG